MICFDVRKNGQRLCLAGIDGRCVLAANVTFVDVIDPGPRPRRTLDLSAGGLDCDGQIHLHWGRSELSVGDRVEITILDSDSPDKPVDSSGVMNPRKEARLALDRIQARRKALLEELAQLDQDKAAYEERVKPTRRKQTAAGRPTPRRKTRHG